MNAANASLQTSVLESERRAHEPSMEEILASIRKIIADDDALPLTRPVAEPRSTLSAPKPFDKPFETVFTQPAETAFAQPAETAFAQPADTNVTPLSMRPAFAAEQPEPSAAEDRETAASASIASETEHEDPTLSLNRIDPADDAALASALDQDAALLDGAALPDDKEVGAVAFGATVLRSSPEDDDLASLAEIAGELSAHDLLPAIADESPQEIPVEMHATAGEYAGEQSAGAQPAVPAADEAVAETAMLSPESDASVASAFRALSASVQLASTETIDRQVRELLRPMLKQWLDDNLPVMVERLVRVEIERVARGGR